MKKLGSIEWLSLVEVTGHDLFEGCEMGIRHRGPRVIQEWGRRLQALHVAEMKRIVREREGLTPEIAPDFWPERLEWFTDGKPENNVRRMLYSATAEGAAERDGLMEEVLRDLVSGLKGFSDLEEGKEVDALLAYGIGQHCMMAALGVQSLTPFRRAAPADSSDAAEVG